MLDKRRFLRFQKQYTIIFCLKDKPHRTYDMTRLYDISQGGLKFLSYDYFEPGNVFLFQIRFPFLYPTIVTIEGKVVGVEDVMPGKTWKIRVAFINVSPQILGYLDQMEKINIKNK